MKKYLITGAKGFVGKYFLEYIDSIGEDCQVLGIDRNSFEDDVKFKNFNFKSSKIDLLDNDELKFVLNKFNPDFILHLASSSSVAKSWVNPADCFINNTNIFLNIIENLRLINSKAKVLSIGSSEQYGTVSIKDIPISESVFQFPTSPYAIARVSQEMLSKIYSDKFGINIVLTRSFNHFGPTQRNNFVIPAFINRLLEAKNNSHKDIFVGNIELVRDFLDVRDVASAYYKLLHFGKIGEVYNVCSGEGYSLKSILDLICDLINYNVNYIVDSNLLRPTENQFVIGSNVKLINELNWKPSYNLKQSLVDMIDFKLKGLKK